MSRQRKVSKIVLWSLLGADTLVFFGLFLLFVFERGNRPEIVEYGGQFLDTNWGVIATVVLILSGLTMALAVLSAKRSSPKCLTFFLLLSLLFAGDFLLVKHIEYSHTGNDNRVQGVGFYAGLRGLVPAAGEETPQPGANPQTEAMDAGKRLWNATCRACHGAGGEGVTGLGLDVRGTEFTLGKTDDELVAFIKKGRMPGDPENMSGVPMPPRGGNPMIKDDDLLSIVGYMRTFVGEGSAATIAVVMPTKSGIEVTPEPTAAARTEAFDGNAAGEEQMPRTEHASDPNPPASAQPFSGVHILTIGLHTVHVLVGMLLITYLLVRSIRGHFSSRYFMPLSIGGLYWFVINVVWVLLFPLFYFIR